MNLQILTILFALVLSLDQVTGGNEKSPNPLFKI